MLKKAFDPAAIISREARIPSPPKPPITRKGALVLDSVSQIHLRAD
jgi:hypothetical protein